MKTMMSDDQITDLAEQYVKILFPEEYVTLKESYERGHWVKEHLPAGTRLSGGIFLGRVTLYRLQTAIHRDRLDTICVAICAGRFEGGEGIFPDLWLKFRCAVCSGLLATRRE